MKEGTPPPGSIRRGQSPYSALSSIVAGPKHGLNESARALLHPDIDTLEITLEQFIRNVRNLKPVNGGVVKTSLQTDPPVIRVAITRPQAPRMVVQFHFVPKRNFTSGS